ncbi:MAG: 2-C-methyl-D-erythritol 2,4-cyclodiphosphate synthase [Desulfobacterales bacterium]|jgi:2-C-methyl-D-erythritol 2,4-cyclodiphosphate synthase|nr:2-C-methyl-D-erythritol 2,4-cyclodiphosphate synthase [Desulfobacterales bacterium]
MRVGTGYDVHRLVPGRKLVIGGVAIPYEKGLLGHSDADVLIHAICDALLGAAGLDDIGVHFPDTALEYQNINSIRLLEQTRDILSDHAYLIENLDAVILAQAPKMSPHRLLMRQRIATALGVNEDQVNIKATTTEGLGYIGKGDGIAAMCTVLIRRREPDNET